jgi:hypothetical protein
MDTAIIREMPDAEQRFRKISDSGHPGEPKLADSTGEREPGNEKWGAFSPAGWANRSRQDASERKKS